MAKLLRVLCATVCGLLVAVAIQSKQLAAPPMGFNTWNFYACDIDENIIKETADAMASKVANLGYKYLNIDDCWQAPYRDKDGKLVADPTRFPSGIKSLADYVHNLGHSLTHSLTHLLTHLLTHSLTHSRIENRNLFKRWVLYLSEISSISWLRSCRCCHIL